MKCQKSYNPAKDNIVLTGMPTAGKSTAGVILAKVLGKMFIDTDLILQLREGRTLKSIISSRGIDAFLTCEENAVLSVRDTNSVIATGGSVIYGEAAMEHLSSNGIIVYLKVSQDELKKRLHHARERGVVLRPGQGLEEMFAEREALYERYADIVVDETGYTIEDTVKAIQEAVSGS